MVHIPHSHIKFSRCGTLHTVPGTDMWLHSTECFIDRIVTLFCEGNRENMVEEEEEEKKQTNWNYYSVDGDIF